MNKSGTVMGPFTQDVMRRMYDEGTYTNAQVTPNYAGITCDLCKDETYVWNGLKVTRSGKSDSRNPI